MYLHLLPVDDDLFVQWLRREDILHAAHELELVGINLFYMANCSAAYSALFIVFAHESTYYLVEIEFVAVFHVHLCNFLEWTHFSRKHHISVQCDQLGRSFQQSRRIYEIHFRNLAFHWYLMAFV